MSYKRGELMEALYKDLENTPCTMQELLCLHPNSTEPTLRKAINRLRRDERVRISDWVRPNDFGRVAPVYSAMTVKMHDAFPPRKLTKDQRDQRYRDRNKTSIYARRGTKSIWVRLFGNVQPSPQP